MTDADASAVVGWCIVGIIIIVLGAALIWGVL